MRSKRAEIKIVKEDEFVVEGEERIFVVCSRCIVRDKG